MAKSKIDKATLRQRIQELDIDNELKSQLLDAVSEQKKYGLVWEDHKEDAEEVLREKIPVLVEDKQLAILSPSLNREGRGGSPSHILIEGDNLHALTALTYTHEGMVDVIYIDPPYNTGNKDFVYNDSFVDNEDGYRHSKWLSFMEKRLRIAKKLLSDRGVIFISIDDNEQANLKLLCDEVFGEFHFIGLVTRATGTTTGQDTGSMGKACDYILVYSNCDNYQIGGIPLSEKDLERYSMEDERGNYSILQLRRTGGEDKREDRPTMFFPIEAPDGTMVLPYGPTGYESRWRVGPEKVKQMRKDNLLYFKRDKDGDWKVYYKFYAEGKTKRPSNLWTELDGNKKAQIELKGIIPNAKFETPKPLAVIKRIEELTTSKYSLILDFFAGSGTTLHATMQLNEEDGGHRKCILVTNNENNICRDVTYERNKRVINGYTTPKGVEVPGLTNNNLRYYKVDFAERENSIANRQELMRLATDMLCIKHDIYDEQKQFGSLQLKSRFVKYFTSTSSAQATDTAKQMLVVYEPRAIEFIAKELRDNPTLATKDNKLIIYVYSDGGYAYDDEFEGLLDKVELISMPDALNKAIRNVLPAPQEDTTEIEEGGQK